MMATKTITLKSGQQLTLQLSEEWDEITFHQNNEKLKGEFKFDDTNEDQTSFLLKRMYCPPGLKKQGIGKAALEFFKSVTGAYIWVREINGEKQPDESHLTEDAPSFVKRMREKGLIEPSNMDNDIDEDYHDSN